MSDQFIRSRAILGSSNIDKLQHSHVAVFGLGGVGGTCLEALVRTGFKNFVLCDFDKVDPSNLNTQG